MLKATTIVLVPIAILTLVGFTLHDKEFREAAQEATAGLVTLIPEGLVLLMSVTLALAAVRLARQDTLVQQMAATEALAAVDTICVDKTGTLTDGTLELVEVEVADRAGPAAAERALATFAASAGERNRTLETIAERYPGRAERVGAEVPFSSAWKWSGLDARRHRSYVLGAPDVLAERGALALPRGARARARRAHRRRAAGGRLRRGARGAARRSGAAAAAGARAAGAGRARGDACDPTPPRRSPSCATSRST